MEETPKEKIPSKRKRLRRILLGILILIPLSSPLIPRLYDRISNDSISPGPYPISEEAHALHQSLFVADLHSDALLWNRNLLERLFGFFKATGLIVNDPQLQTRTV